MNIVKKRLFLTVVILLMCSRSFCSENTETGSWFGGMYTMVKRYLNDLQWPKTFGGVPLLYGMRSYSPKQSDVREVRVPSMVRSARYEIRKAKGATQEEFEEIQQNLTKKLQQHQLTPPRATFLESHLKALSADEKREKEIVVDADRKLSLLENMINSKQELSADQLEQLEKRFKEIENSLSSLKVSRNREYVEHVIARKDNIRQAFERSRSVPKPGVLAKSKNARKKEQQKQKK